LEGGQLKNETIKKKSMAAELLGACRQHPGLDPRGVLEAIGDPQWDHASRTNDWRNYVDGDVIDLWAFLCVEAKLVAYLTAASQSFLDD
jgi:hypothetical protein